MLLGKGGVRVTDMGRVSGGKGKDSGGEVRRMRIKGEEESMQGGREKRRVRMCRSFPSTGHTQVIFASRESEMYILIQRETNSKAQTKKYN